MSKCYVWQTLNDKVIFKDKREKKDPTCSETTELTSWLTT